ncbi:hypothetical protein ACJ72_06453 [Emergomyces africanus]|uniref:Protein transport protein BOS1 n=1 Tax=Emergomyces africanus TaxID=1955775 RepID=A0A1B7NR06_9EURO|nr:hypothetical protein ACJ72_06453 [Emergomyces africanus]
MNSLFNAALKQSSALRRDLEAFAEAPTTTSPAVQGQISASLTSFSRTIDDYSSLSKQELIPSKQELAFERLKNFRTELADYRQLFDRLKKEREDAVRTINLIFPFPRSAQVCVLYTTQNLLKLRLTVTQTAIRLEPQRTPRSPPPPCLHPRKPLRPIQPPPNLPLRQPKLRKPPLLTGRGAGSSGGLGFSGGPTDYTRENHALREQSFFSNTNAQLDEFLDRGRAVLGDLGQQREILKGTQRRLYNVANTLGVSGDTIRTIERRAKQDKWIFWVRFLTLAHLLLNPSTPPSSAHFISGHLAGNETPSIPPVLPS